MKNPLRLVSSLALASWVLFLMGAPAGAVPQ
jgi:hypothetical protein